MTDPFIFESEFQKLKQILALTSGNRLKLHYVLNYIEPLLNKKEQFILAAYLEELLPYLTLIFKIDFTGTNLSFLLRLKNLLEALCLFSSVYSESREIKYSIDHLNSESEKIKHWLDNKKVDRILEFSNIKVNTQQKNASLDSVWIPLIEKEQLLAEIKPQFATIKKLKVDVSFSNKKGDDELILSGYQSTEQAGQKEIKIALTAAKNLFTKFTKVEINKKLLVYCNFDDANTFAGESLEAGLTSAIFCELLRLHRHKEEFLIRNDVAVTGKIDKNGILHPVDEEGLRLKVEACVFSFIKYLVVPKEQEEICRNYISELESVNNSGELEIIDINSIEEIYINRKYTDLYHVPLIKQSARKIWRARRSVSAIVFLILILILGKMLYGPIDKNPAYFEAKGEYLLIKNKYGEKLDLILVGNKTLGSNGLILTNIVSIFDVNNDGWNDIIWAQKSKNEMYDEIICKDFKNNTLLWILPLKQKLIFPSNPIPDDNFCCIKFLIGDFDKDKSPELILLSHHFGYYPSLILKIDPRTGKELKSYLNTGNLLDMSIADLDEDGFEDIIIAGINNSLHSACLLVLDPRFIYGCSPHSQETTPEGFGKGLEKYYITLPRSIIGKIYLENDVNEYNTANYLQIYYSLKNFKVILQDCYTKDWQATFAVYFNFNMSPINFITGDTYDKLAGKYFKEGRINQKIDQKYFWEDYVNTIQYWDGDKFVNKPTINKRYQEEVKELKK